MHLIRKSLFLLGIIICTSTPALADVQAVSDTVAQGSLNTIANNTANASGSLQTISTNTTNATTLLQIIANKTTEILNRVDNLPGVLAPWLTYLNSWILATDSDTFTPVLQNSMATIGQQVNTSNASQAALLQALNTSLLTLPANNPQGTPSVITAAQLPNINDLVYSSVLGMPFSPATPPRNDPIYNYIVNASGLGLPHRLPPSSGGSNEDINSYKAYYNTVMAAESFGSYVLSSNYQDANQFTAQQTALLNTASTSSWFAFVKSTEHLGDVLRHILMFESQNYVMLTQLVQLQKQTLNAQVMTNSLLIANNRLNEHLLVSSAQGVAP